MQGWGGGNNNDSVYEEAQPAFRFSAVGVDAVEKLHFSYKKLYGRGKDIYFFQRCYESLSPTDSQVVFLSGRSGSGKSALINEFVQRQQPRRRQNVGPIYICAKYSELRTEDPHRAITEAIGKWCQNLTQQDKESVRYVCEKLQNTLGESDINLLAQLIPGLSRLLFNGNYATSARSMTTMRQDQMNMAKLKFMFQNLICALSTAQRPLILFFDDLQWADAQSIELIHSIVGNKLMTNVLFIGAFRSNEVGEDHLLTRMINSLQQGRENIQVHELRDLSWDDIGEFLEDSLQLGADLAWDLTDVIFEKTNGNINHTRQAVEQMVRNKVLFYDARLRCWNCNLERHELEKQLSFCITDIIRSKIQHEKVLLQQALLIASYIRWTFDFDTLIQSMETVGLHFLKNDIIKVLNLAVNEGMLVRSEHVENEYCFAHDSIQETAQSLAEGEERLEMLKRIGSALAQRGNSEEFGQDWMLFTAAHHWNTVRAGSIWPNTDEDRLSVASLNLQTAKLSLKFAGFEESVNMLYVAIDCLDPHECWERNYKLTMELYRLLMETEFSLGNYDKVRDIIGQILEHANSVDDKGPAFVLSLGIIMQGKNRDHGLAIKKGKAYLAWIGHSISVDPDNVEQSDLEQAEEQASLALGQRKVADLANSPGMKSDTVLRILERMAKAALYSGKVPFLYVLGQVAIKICAKEGINEYLPRILMYSQMYFRKKGLYLRAYDCAVTCKSLVDELLDSASVESFCTVSVTCSNGLQLFQPVRRAVDVYEECYTKCIRAGDTEFAFLVANSYAISFFLSGSPITSLSENRFTLFEEECVQYKQPPSIHLVFMIYRQCILNVRGRSENPVVFDGDAMTEKGVLYGHFSEDSPQYKQTLRDFSMCKMMTACIFGDHSVMEEMIENLQTWPDFDILLHRMNQRLVWQALGAFSLARAGRKHRKKYLELGRKYLRHYEENAEKGNPNARVIMLCLKAENNQTKNNYHIAIDACQELEYLHLEALMNENCGLCQLQRKKKQKGQRYLFKACQLYLQYGATAKVNQMIEKFSFLNGTTLEDLADMSMSDTASHISQTESSVTAGSISRQSCTERSAGTGTDVSLSCSVGPPKRAQPSGPAISRVSRNEASIARSA